jgi:hypothetical protein
MSKQDQPEDHITDPRLLDTDDDTPMLDSEPALQLNKSKRKVSTADDGPPLKKLRKIKKNSAASLSQPEPHMDQSSPRKKVKKLRKSEPPQPQPQSSPSDTDTPPVNWQFSPLRNERKNNRSVTSVAPLPGQSTEKTGRSDSKTLLPKSQSETSSLNAEAIALEDSRPLKKAKKDKSKFIPPIDHSSTKDRDTSRLPSRISRSVIQNRDEALVEATPSQKQQKRRKSDPALTQVSSNEDPRLRNPSPPKTVPKVAKRPKKTSIITPMPYSNEITPDRTPISRTPDKIALAAEEPNMDAPTFTPVNNTVRPSSLLQALKARRAAELNNSIDPSSLDRTSEPTRQELERETLPSNPDVPTSAQKTPFSPRVLASSSKSKSKKSRKSKKQQREQHDLSLGDAMEIEEAQPAELQKPDHSQPERDVENAMETERAADIKPTQDVVEEVRETPEPERAQDHATPKSVRNTAEHRRRVTRKATHEEQNGRASHGSDLIGAAKELASVRELSHPPDVRTEGPFSDDEAEIIRRAIANYKRKHRLDIDGLVNVIQASRPYRSGVESRQERASRLDQEKVLQDIATDFWIEIFQALPDRKKPSVRKAIRAKYHNNKGHGNWDEEDDERLRELYEAYGSQWTVIAEQMGNRDDISCRHRWNNYLHPGEQRNTERWTEEEETKLRRAVRDATDRSRQEVNWTDVSAAMGTRSRVQIAQKWKKMMKREFSDPNTMMDAQPRGRKSRKPKSRVQPRQYDDAAKDRPRPQPDTVLHSVETPAPDNTKVRTIGAELMRAGDKVDLMESVMNNGRPARIEDIEWDKVANNLRLSRWSATDCKDGFRQLLAYAGPQASFPEALSALDVLMSEVTGQDREQIYDRGEDDEELSSQKIKSSEFVAASDDEE